MDSLDLRLFVHAADLENISAAGRRLGMAPSVASTRLAKLEKQLGADLLIRSTRKVSLSQEGTAFLPYAREIIAQEDAGLAVIGQGTPDIQGTLRFTAPSSFAQLHILPVLGEFLSRHPKLQMDLRLSDSQFDLIEGGFDLALRNAPLADSTLKGRKLADDIRVLCAAPSYCAAYGTPSAVEELIEHGFIGFRGYSPRALINNDGERIGFDFEKQKTSLVVDDGSAQRLLTLAGLGISVNSLWSVAGELETGALVRILPDHRIEDDTALWLIYPHANVLSAKVSAFMQFLVERVGNPLRQLQRGLTDRDGHS